MGNQASRIDRESSTIASDDPCLNNIRQWHINDTDEPYKRQYHLPAITNDHNRIKPRKQSSPAAVTHPSKSASTVTLSNRRPPFSKLFQKSSRNLSRNNSCVDSTTAFFYQQNSNHTLLTKQLSLNTTLSHTNNTHYTNNNTLPTSTCPNTTLDVLNEPQQQPNLIHPLAPTVASPKDFFSFDHRISMIGTIPEHHQRITNNRNSLSSSQLKQATEHHLEQEQLFSFRMLGERKYSHIKDSNYLLPCDEEEVDRLHLQHFMIRFAIQGNYLAPVSDVLRKGGRVLDVGCGPGAWSMEIAGEYPKSTVIGIDIAPIYPKDIIPSNCVFYQCNVLNKLPFEDNTFDYIFMRFMGQGVESDKWASVLAELVRVLKPRGWIEWIEADSEIHRPGPITHDFNQKLMNLMIKNKQDPHIGRTLKERLSQHTELINATSTYVSCPGGQWAGKLGQLTMQSWKAYYQAFSPLICQLCEIAVKDYTDKLKSCWREADEYKTFENVHFSYAQKRPFILQ
ncbi:hypothetical protein BD560DRAFT_432297 [Blakeslea trispora]|nr:hypothetical protein BD560DRAFT_432297 [Blakeslea trispora]